ncbi:DEAD/DEAH box helicase [Nocardioides terrisoli]|uniref:DEAD/DEAH box helicase n=1 Tax=Nocardioides terrisoli TaxID=3388267 RepID=UPI00287B9549|nr:DEAD/DEAH box helicase [Nocardioides marmorisolisilvae]
MLDIPESALDKEFGRETVRRAQAYVAQGRVLGFDVATTRGGDVELIGSVRGTRPEPYRVTVRAATMRHGTEIWSVCDCPVGLGCKHGVALILGARRDLALLEGGPDPDRWAGELEDALLELEARSSAEGTGAVPLALQVDLKVARYRWSDHPVRTIRLRPLQRGKLGRWIKTGADWHQVNGLRYGGAHDPMQVEILAELATVLGPAYGGPADLARVGPALWPMLTRVCAAGIELVPGEGIAEVELLEEPVAVTADLRSTETGLSVRLGVGVGDRSWSADAIEPIGNPAHGVALLTAAGGGRAAPSMLTLAPLVRLLPERVQALLRRTEPLVVPDEARQRFEDAFLPRLRRQLATTSTDGSVPLPEEPEPRLVLELEWLSPGQAAASFGWSYPVAGAESRYALDSGAGMLDVRRTDAEDSHLSRLTLDDAARDLLCDAGGRLRGEHRWTGADLLRFVDDVLPGLRADDAIDVEETGTQPDYRPAVGAPEISFSLAGPEAGPDGQEADRRTDWLDLEVMIRVDGEQVPLASVLTALTRRAERIFLPSGLHVRADHPAFDRLAELVAAAGELADQPSERLRVGSHDLGAWAELDELGVVDEQAAAWVASARALQSAERLPEVATTGLTCTLRSYQYDGFRWLAFLWQAGLGGILADDMGLGKTLQALALVAHARAKGAAPFLVVAPTSVVTAWRAEAAQHAPDLVVRTVEGTGARRAESVAELAEGADLVLTSYTLLRLEAEAYAGLAWGGLVLDEAQQIKNHQAKTYRAVRGIDAPFRVALTGTPFENRLMELWALLSVVAPGLYPSPQRFRDLVVRPVEAGDAAALDRFRRRIRPFLLRRTKDLVAADMPPKQEQLLEVTLGPRHRRIYDTHLQRERQTVLGLVEEFDRHRIAIFRSLTRLRQLSLDAALLDPAHDKVASAKVDLLVEHLTELAAEGHRALVFSQFTSFLKRVRERLDREGIETCYLDGRTRDRQRVIEGFRTGAAPAFLISLKAGGVGLTLTEADYVYVLDPWWNPAVEAQAVDRTHRIGQQRPVMVYRLVATDTIEEKVVALKERKAALFARVLDGGGAGDGAIDADDVRALFDAPGDRVGGDP